MTFKPLLAAQVDFDKLDFQDLWLSPKLDGIRAIVIGGVVMSRSLKPIPNKHVQSLFKHLEHYDGELICGSPTSPTCYRDTNSAVMSIEGQPDVTFYVFDHVEFPEDQYHNRYNRLSDGTNVKVLLHHTLDEGMADIEALEETYLKAGYEGVMLRKARGPNSKYKFGRATAKSNTLLKVKRFQDSEYMIVGMEERQHNGNEATVDALGHTKRSSHSENKVGRGDMGALVMEFDGGTFNCGTGFDDEFRKWAWENEDLVIGRMGKVKSFLIGVKDKPRFPVWLGFRSDLDM